MNKIYSLSQAINEGRVFELPACDKATALRLLAEKITASQKIPADFQLLDGIERREAQSLTYLGYGVACPHARSEHSGDELVCAVGWSPSGIEYGNTDGWTVHLVLMYFVPASAQHEYLAELSRLARAIESDKAKHELVNLDDIDDVCSRLGRWALGKPNDDDENPRQTPVSVLSGLLLPDIIEMIEEGRLNDLRVFLAAQPAPEIAELIEVMRGHNRCLLFRMLPRRVAQEVFSLLDFPAQELLLENMAQEETRHFISSLPPDDRTALFEELPANVTQRLMGLLSDKDRKQALTLLSYPRGSVGRLMTNQYVTIRAEWSVEKAIEHIRKTGHDSETMVMVYVVDEEGKLINDLLLRKLIMAQPTTLVGSILVGKYVALNSLEDREDAVNIFKKYDLYALPVVDEDGVLLGIVTADDLLDVSEDIHKAGAITPLSAGYLDTSLKILYRSRVPWLITLVFINIFSGAGIAYFEELLETTVALVFFLPLLIDSAGNAGSQAATLIIRSMTLGELRPTDFMRALMRETIVSVGLGISMALAVFALAWWRSGIRIGIVVAISMTLVVLMGSVMGMMLPFILRKFKLDPAVASAPLVTSIADIVGVLVYLSLASAILG